MNRWMGRQAGEGRYVGSGRVGETYTSETDVGWVDGCCTSGWMGTREEQVDVRQVHGVTGSGTGTREEQVDGRRISGEWTDRHVGGAG